MAPFLIFPILLTQKQDVGVRLYDTASGPKATAVLVNGAELNELALIRDRRVQVPFRALFERLGANVQWYPQNRKVVATKGDRTITLVVGENFAYVPEHRVLDYPPRIVNGRVMVPIRFVSENLGAQVHWDSNARTVRIETEDAER